MEQNKWIEEELKILTSEAGSYQEKALMQELGKLIDEQEVRIERLRGEIDGVMWSPNKWKE
ncbi:hypothetical protein ACWN8V_11290 [Vagococcus elongatus]|uniref:Phage protein n=1 Tax=Vagococcus elongatus TaxID=180344 RepID=A0A430AMY0_9ENTE|nr:hypothetical protein [Vagococcus elongatus]RSU09449.1 hypothetical protein CBF29_11410 [Vagococcus elongatus]